MPPRALTRHPEDQCWILRQELVVMALGATRSALRIQDPLRGGLELHRGERHLPSLRKLPLPGSASGEPLGTSPSFLVRKGEARRRLLDSSPC